MPDILTTVERIEHAHRTFLLSAQVSNDPAFDRERKALFLEPDGVPLTKPPLIEATPSYETGPTLTELHQRAPDEVGRLPTVLPAWADRPLFTHQAAALTHSRAGRHLLIASGTGSGKTECFLMPIIRDLLAEAPGGPEGPGVRALILYPMNALVDDQIARLRKLEIGNHGLTFGRYTAITPTRYQSDHQTALGEVLDREGMRRAPPHILITNYAMLEYMLLRDDDDGLFDASRGLLRYVVLDEAHSYAGSKGAEVRCLLNRLRSRLDVDGSDTAPRFIASSATMGGPDSDEEMSRFLGAIANIPPGRDQGHPGQASGLARSRRPAAGAPRHPG